MDIILKAFQLPRDIQTVIREYGVVQVKNYLICVDNVTRYKRSSMECTLYRTKVLNVEHIIKKKSKETIIKLSKNIVVVIYIHVDCVKHALHNIANHTVDYYTIY